jgi:hypothetical protein
MHKILQNFHTSVSGNFGRLGSSHFLSENFMTSVIKLGLKMVIVPNVNRPIVMLYGNAICCCYIVLLYGTVIWWCYMVVLYGGVIWWCYMVMLCKVDLKKNHD